MSSAVSAWLLMLLHIVAATDDIRARVSFLVGAFWPFFATAAIFTLISVAAVAWVGVVTRSSAIGVMMGAVTVTLVLLSNGVAVLIPELHNRFMASFMAIATTLVVVLCLLWERNHGASSGSSQSG